MLLPIRSSSTQNGTVLLKIDIHTHILPEKMPDWAAKFGYGGFISLDHHKPNAARMMADGRFFREIQCNCWDLAQRIKECDAFHCQVQVLSTVPVLFHYWAKPDDCLQTSRFFNDHIADIAYRMPNRFVGLGTIPLQDPQLAIRELERCMGELGLAGVQIGTHVNDWNLSDPELFPFFQACERLNAAIFVHPWDMMGQNKMTKYWLPWLVGMPAETSLAICSMIFGGVLERLPLLRVAFAHGGGSFPSTIGRIEHGFQVRPDLCAIDNDRNPREYLGKFWLDTLVHDGKVLKYLIDLVGSKKICIGSDYPFPLGEDLPGQLVIDGKFNSGITEDLMHNAALEWLQVKKERFL